MSVSLLVVAVVALLVAGVARRRGWPAPLLLVVVGLVAAAIPGVTEVRLDPNLVLFVVLPPLLFSASLNSSVMRLRQNVRSVSLLAVGLPVLSTIVVGFVAYAAVPQLPLSSAMVLGAVVAPPDAVAATAVGRRLGLPRRVMTLLSGESLLNDATALTVFKVAVASAVGAGMSALEGAVTFVLAVVVGVGLGLVIGFLVDQLRSRMDDPTLESAIGLVVPFGAYLVAEDLHGSGVLAVVTAGLFLGQRRTGAGFATRLQDTAVWRAADIVLESVVFLLIGLQLRGVVGNLNGESAWILFGTAFVVLATVIAVRMAVMMGSALAPRVMFDRRSAPPSARAALVVSWAGMRGVVSLAAAAAVPYTTSAGTPFPGRNQIIFLTFVVVVGTLLLHGSTLPWLIRRLGVHGSEARIDAVSEAAARERAAEAAIARLDDLVAGENVSEARRRAANLLRSWTSHRRDDAWRIVDDEEPRSRDVDALGGREGSVGDPPPRTARDRDDGETAATAFRSMRRSMLRAERRVYIEERDAGRIDDDVLRRLQRDLDLEEAMLDQRG